MYVLNVPMTLGSGQTESAGVFQRVVGAKVSSASTHADTAEPDRCF